MGKTYKVEKLTTKQLYYQEILTLNHYICLDLENNSLAGRIREKLSQWLSSSYILLFDNTPLSLMKDDFTRCVTNDKRIYCKIINDFKKRGTKFNLDDGIYHSEEYF